MENGRQSAKPVKVYEKLKETVQILLVVNERKICPYWHGNTTDE